LKEKQMNRTRVIAGLIVLVLLVSLTPYAANVLIRKWGAQPPQVGQRSPAPGLSYCAPEEARPCVISFQVGAPGDMIIQLLADPSSPDFDVVIRADQQEKHYTCQPSEQSIGEVVCTGEAVPAGKALSFSLIARPGKVLLAEGTFSIIGIALATPEILFTPTPVSIFERPPR
jgi:hypothetical protein